MMMSAQLDDDDFDFCASHSHSSSSSRAAAAATFSCINILYTVVHSQGVFYTAT
jgi:hypothetical protein